MKPVKPSPKCRDAWNKWSEFDPLNKPYLPIPSEHFAAGWNACRDRIIEGIKANNKGYDGYNERGQNGWARACNKVQSIAEENEKSGQW